MQKLGPAMASDRSADGAARHLDRWFESEELKGTIATDAISARSWPSMPERVRVVPSLMGERTQTRRVSYVRGGMGGLTQALATPRFGVEIRTTAKCEDPRQDGSPRVALTNGDEFRASKVVSGWTALSSRSS